MTKYLTEVQKLAYSFSRLNVLRVSHIENAQADALAMLASTGAPREGWLLAEILPTQTIKKNDVSTIREESSWMDEILHYKRDKTLPIDLIVA